MADTDTVAEETLYESLSQLVIPDQEIKEALVSLASAVVEIQHNITELRRRLFYLESSVVTIYPKRGNTGKL
jgi:hypothetical protein